MAFQRFLLVGDSRPLCLEILFHSLRQAWVGEVVQAARGTGKVPTCQLVATLCACLHAFEAA